MFHTAVQRGFKSRGKYTYFAENSLLFPTVKEFQNQLTVEVTFLPRCMECRRGIVMRKLSVCLCVKRVNC